MGYRLIATDFWYREMPGAMLLKMEQDLLKKVISHIHGDYLVQMGGPSDLSLVAMSPVKKKYYLNQHKQLQSHGSNIIAKSHELPFLPDSLDVIVLAHVIEFVTDPNELLIQIFEALMPNGYCIIFGFNFWSLWHFAKLYNEGEFPWRGKFFSIHTIKHWLRNQHFSLVASKTACFRPPLQSSKLAKNLLFLEPIGQLCFPGCGGFYMIVCQKRVYNAIPEMDKFGWKKYGFENNGFVKPTTRNM